MQQDGNFCFSVQVDLTATVFSFMINQSATHGFTTWTTGQFKHQQNSPDARVKTLHCMSLQTIYTFIFLPIKSYNLHMLDNIRSPYCVYDLTFVSSEEGIAVAWQLRDMVAKAETTVTDSMSAFVSTKPLHALHETSWHFSDAFIGNKIANYLMRRWDIFLLRSFLDPNEEMCQGVKPVNLVIETSGSFQLCLWQQNGIFLWDAGTISSQVGGKKTQIFLKKWLSSQKPLFQTVFPPL